MYATLRFKPTAICKSGSIDFVQIQPRFAPHLIKKRRFHTPPNVLVETPQAETRSESNRIAGCFEVSLVVRLPGDEGKAEVEVQLSKRCDTFCCLLKHTHIHTYTYIHIYVRVFYTHISVTVTVSIPPHKLHVILWYALQISKHNLYTFPIYLEAFETKMKAMVSLVPWFRITYQEHLGI